MNTVNISGVPETMLQTLYARATESNKKNHKIYDEKAIEILKKLYYDFTLADNDSAMKNGVIARTIVLDKLVKKFIKENPNTTVVNIACGLDTRFYRVDNGKINWYNLDLPETMNIRKNLIVENERVNLIAKSAMDESWSNDISEIKNNVLVIIEGLSMYLSENDIKKILNIIDRKFDRVTIYMETMNPFVVRHVKEKSIDASDAKFSWGIKTGKELELYNSNYHFEKDVSLAEGMNEMFIFYKTISWISVIKNISNKITILKKQS